jgi:hypothetical protein
MRRCIFCALLFTLTPVIEPVMLHRAFVWAVRDYHKLKLEDTTAVVCDNTSSNSGMGPTGGWVVQTNRFHPGCKICRIPCTCHVLHIGWGKGRTKLMGKLPSIKERFTDHPWNLYWLVYKEFGLQDPRFVLPPLTTSVALPVCLTPPFTCCYCHYRILLLRQTCC